MRLALAALVGWCCALLASACIWAIMRGVPITYGERRYLLTVHADGVHVERARGSSEAQ